MRLCNNGFLPTPSSKTNKIIVVSHTNRPAVRAFLRLIMVRKWYFYSLIPAIPMGIGIQHYYRCFTHRKTKTHKKPMKPIKTKYSKRSQTTLWISLCNSCDFYRLFTHTFIVVLHTAASWFYTHFIVVLHTLHRGFTHRKCCNSLFTISFSDL